MSVSKPGALSDIIGKGVRSYSTGGLASRCVSGSPRPAAFPSGFWAAEAGSVCCLPVGLLAAEVGSVFSTAGAGFGALASTRLGIKIGEQGVSKSFEIISGDLAGLLSRSGLVCGTGKGTAGKAGGPHSSPSPSWGAAAWLASASSSVVWSSTASTPEGPSSPARFRLSMNSMCSVTCSSSSSPCDDISTSKHASISTRKNIIQQHGLARRFSLQ